MNSLSLVLFILCVCSNIYHLLTVFCGAIFRLRQDGNNSCNDWPKVACLKPLCGRDAGIYENLVSFVEQDYPDYEIILGTADEQDPAYKTAQSLRRSYSSNNIKVVSGELGAGTNRKVRNLKNIYSHVSPDADFLVLSDSDIRVTRDYLKSIIAPFCLNPDIGAVTSVYRVENILSPGDLLEALSVEATFVPGVLVSAAFSDQKFAFGASVVMDRSAFLNAGGFDAIEDYLADDYKIGNIIHKSGKRVILSHYVVSIISSGQGLMDALVHLLRWSRTVRICEPVGYLFSGICHSTFWALALFFATGADSLGWGMLGGTCVVRILGAAAVSASLRSSGGIFRAFLTPIWDLISICIWLTGLVGNRVVWRGTKYRIFPDGRMAKSYNRNEQDK
jgi:ceramide glucosyltransferase